jgi:hypothetical protein
MKVARTVLHRCDDRGDEPHRWRAFRRARALAGSQGRVLVTGSLRTVGEAMMEVGIDGA